MKLMIVDLAMLRSVCIFKKPIKKMTKEDLF